MNSFDELEKQLKRLSELEESPRPEYVSYLDETLQKEAVVALRRMRQRRIWSRTASVAAVVLLASWVATVQWQQPGQHSSTLPADADVPAIHMSEPKPPAATNTVEQQPPVAEEMPVPPVKGKAEDERRATNAPTTKPAGEERQTTKQNEKAAPGATSEAPPLQLAQTYLQQMLGEQSNQYRVNLSGSKLKEGEVVFNRMIHGVPFYADNYKVGIDHDKVSHFTFNSLPEKQRDLSQFPPPNNILSEKQAADLIASTMKPVYRISKDGKLSLRYELNFPGLLDAKTGAMLSPAGVPSQKEAAPKAIPVTPAGKKLNTTSLETTIALLQKEFGISFDASNSASPSMISHGDATGTEYTWNRAEKTIKATVSPDGRLTGYHVIKTNSDPDATTADPDETKRTTRDTDLQTALSHLQRYLDKRITAVELQGASADSTENTYQFGALVDGILVAGRSYSVTLDRSGQVVGMEETRYSPKNPRLSIEADSREDAISEFLTAHELELVYIWPKKDDASGSNGPKLVYQQAPTAK